MSVDHYENFPVASWLCPPAIRPAVRAIYAFARTADDIADEGDADAAQRIADLDAYRDDLLALYDGRPPGPRWAAVFHALDAARQQHRLPLAPLEALLSAFRQDAANPRYTRYEELLDYCSRSANPVGRLMLHLFGMHDPRSQRESDDICTALQLINFWQDLSVDQPRGRDYLPAELLHQHGLPSPLPRDTPADAVAPLVRELCRLARQQMLSGAPLARRVPGRAGWELRLVVHGGLAVLAKIEASNHRSWQTRPRLQPWDAPGLLWRALRGGAA